MVICNLLLNAGAHVNVRDEVRSGRRRIGSLQLWCFRRRPFEYFLNFLLDALQRLLTNTLQCRDQNCIFCGTAALRTLLVVGLLSSPRGCQ